MVAPQFTMNAGLLTLGGVLLLRSHLEEADPFALALGLALAFAGFLVRDQEFWLVLGITWPALLFGKASWRRWSAWALLGFAVLLALAWWLNRAAYQSPEWTAFQAFNAARMPFTDFGHAQLLAQQPDLLRQHGLTDNDSQLLANWFFEDPRTANAETLTRISAALDASTRPGQFWSGGATALAAAWAPSLQPLFMAALFVFLLRPNVRVLLCAALCAAAIFLTGALGRPGILRVYYPLLAALVLLALPVRLSGVRAVAASVVLVGALAHQAVGLLQQNRALVQRHAMLTKEALALGDGPTYVWGAAFPYEIAFPVFGQPAVPMRHPLLGFGVFSHAPNTHFLAMRGSANGFVAQLQSAPGVALIATPGHLEMLGQYCAEKIGAPLVVADQKNQRQFNWTRVRCRN
jgi:hypothetical protein